MHKEPVIAIGAISAAVGAVITLLVAFGVSITAEQTAAILGVVATVGPLLTAIVTRRKVTPAE